RGKRRGMGNPGESWVKREIEVGFGSGIALGYATLGRIGFEGRYDYTAIGAVVNQAARLCAQAAAGQIIVSQRVLSDVESLFEAEFVADMELKGFSKPVPAHNITGFTN